MADAALLLWNAVPTDEDFEAARKWVDQDPAAESLNHGEREAASVAAAHGLAAARTRATQAEEERDALEKMAGRLAEALRDALTPDHTLRKQDERRAALDAYDRMRKGAPTTREDADE
jgi:hypothetical protein